MELHRVFRRKHKEEFGQLVSLALQTHLAFFHRFQERTLRAGRRTVNLVGQQHLREHGTLADFKISGIRPVHGAPRNVGRQQVGRKLDAGKVRPYGHGERLRKRRLARTGNILDKHVTVGKERHHEHFNTFVLAKQHGIESIQQALHHNLPAYLT